MSINRTRIEWVLNPDGTQGYTWNPITGCLNGCPYCYARKLANGRLKSLYLANTNIAGDQSGYKEYVLQNLNNPFYPRLWEDRLDEPMWYPYNFRYRHPTPKGIFVCDMSDLFGVGIPEEWTSRVLDVIKINPEHRFYLLTKQPQNLSKFSPFPDNCWVGVTATESDLFANAVNNLMNIQAKVKYVSIEPLLSWQKLDISTWLRQIDWVIIGAQTKPYKPPKWEWVSEIIDACVNVGIPYFLKNNLEKVVPKVFGGEGKLNQEMPR